MTSEIDDYIGAHTSPDPAHLRRLERATHLHLLNGQMCSGHVQGRLLKMLVTMIRPRRIIELGTFSAYSALSMAEGLAAVWGDTPTGTCGNIDGGDCGYIDTVETDDELEDFIRGALADSPHGGRVRLHIGDGAAFMARQPDGHYDLAFIDADKRRYADDYEACMRLVRPGGFILADNTLWYGHVADPARQDPQTRGIRALNDRVAADPRAEQVILPLRDGLTLIRKVKDER